MSYIKLDRSIRNWEWINEPNTLRLWIHLLCTANWKQSRYKGIDVAPGQMIASLAQLAEDTGLTVDMIRTAKKHLIRTGEITCQSTRHGDLITVENWAKYQGDGAESPTGLPKDNPKQIPRNFPSSSQAIEEEVEEIKNNINSARTPAPARSHIEEKEYDFSNGHVVNNVWLPNERSKTPKERRENYYKYIAYIRGEGGPDA